MRLYILLLSGVLFACTQSTLPELEKSSGGITPVAPPSSGGTVTPDSSIFLPLPPRDDIKNPNATNPVLPIPSNNPNVTLPPSSNTLPPSSDAITPLNPSQPVGPVIPNTAQPVTPPMATAGNGSCKSATISKDQIKQWVEAAGGANGSVRYMYVPTDLLVPGKEREADLARVGGLKALFHTSFVEQVSGFADVSQGHCAVYKINLEQVWEKDWQTNWNIVTASRPANDRSSDPAQQPFVKLTAEDSADHAAGMISAARLAYAIFYPSNYTVLAKLPSTNSGIQQTAAKAVGGYVNGIPCGPRKLEIRGSTLAGKERLYFMTGDPGDRGEPDKGFPSKPPMGSYNSGHNLPGMPGRFIGGSETIQQLPNGLLRFIVFRNTGDSGTKALQTGVIDPANPHNGYMLVVGRSCISCHNNGIRGMAVDTAKMGNGWSTQEELDPLFQTAQNEYFKGMAEIVNRVVGGDQAFKEQLIRGRSREPISYLIARLETVAYGQKNPSRPYTTCRTSKGDKFQMQVENMFKDIESSMAALGSGTSISPTPAPGASAPNPLAQGMAAFQKSCATAGCHSAPASTDRLINGKTVIPDRMINNAKRLNPGISQAEIDAISAYLKGS